MKNFSSRTRASSRRNSNRQTIITIVLTVVLACVFLFFVGRALGTIASFITTPIYGVRAWFAESSATLPSYFRSRNELLATIDDLKQQIAAQSGADATTKKLAEENEEIRALMGAAHEERVLAGVISRPPMMPYDALLIDQGSQNGVKENAIVYHYDDRAIGFVSRAFPTSALVTLFSRPDIEATAYIYGPDIYTTVRGVGAGVMKVNVPQGITLTKGDVVVLPSIESGIIGTIETIESDPIEPEQSGFITSSVSLQSLQYVSISSETLKTITFEEAQAQVADTRAALLHIDVPPAFFTGTTTATTTATSTTPATTTTNAGTSSNTVIGL